jgi:hypothetical protein
MKHRRCHFVSFPYNNEQKNTRLSVGRVNPSSTWTRNAGRIKLMRSAKIRISDDLNARIEYSAKVPSTVKLPIPSLLIAAFVPRGTNTPMKGLLQNIHSCPYCLAANLWEVCTKAITTLLLQREEESAFGRAHYSAK